MIKMLTPCTFHCFYASLQFVFHTDVEDGNITAVLSNPAVTVGLLKSWYAEGATVNDVVERLRLRTVPCGYTIHSWTEGAVVDNQYNSM